MKEKKVECGVVRSPRPIQGHLRSFSLHSLIIHEKSTPWGASVSVLELVDQLLMIGLDDVKTLLNVLDQFSDFPLVDCPPSLNVLDVTI